MQDVLAAALGDERIGGRGRSSEMIELWEGVSGKPAESMAIMAMSRATPTPKPRNGVSLPSGRNRYWKLSVGLWISVISVE